MDMTGSASFVSSSRDPQDVTLYCDFLKQTNRNHASRLSNVVRLMLRRSPAADFPFNVSDGQVLVLLLSTLNVENEFSWQFFAHLVVNHLRHPRAVNGMRYSVMNASLQRSFWVQFLSFLVFEEFLSLRDRTDPVKNHSQLSPGLGPPLSTGDAVSLRLRCSLSVSQSDVWQILLFRLTRTRCPFSCHKVQNPWCHNQTVAVLSSRDDLWVVVRQVLGWSSRRVIYGFWCYHACGCEWFWVIHSLSSVRTSVYSGCLEGTHQCDDSSTVMK